jgi:hypothetical protein
MRNAVNDLAEFSRIIEMLISDDPWESSWDGMGDCCHFCGSDDLVRSAGPPDLQTANGPAHRRPRTLQSYGIHEPACPWVQAHHALGRRLPERHFTTETRPEWLRHG